MTDDGVPVRPKSLRRRAERAIKSRLARAEPKQSERKGTMCKLIVSSFVFASLHPPVADLDVAPRIRSGCV